MYSLSHAFICFSSRIAEEREKINILSAEVAMIKGEVKKQAKRVRVIISYTRSPKHALTNHLLKGVNGADTFS